MESKLQLRDKMEDVIIIRYGEIGIKSKWVRREFENQLIDNISRALVSNDVEIEKISKVGGRIYLWCNDIKKSLNLLKNVFGIVSYSPAKLIIPDLIEMKKKAVEVYEENSKDNKKKFRITTTRRNKEFPLTSMEVSSEIGEYVIEKTGAEVDLINYGINICFEINKNDAFVFSGFHKGYGGLPIGTQGKVLCYISESKESYNNVFLIARRGCEVILVGEKINLDNFKKDFEKDYYHFEEKLACFEIENFDFDEINKIAKNEGVKAIVLEKKHIGKFEDIANFSIFYPSIGSELTFYI